MLARRFLYRKQLWNVSCNCTHIRCVQNVSQVQETVNLETRLPALLKKKPQRKPFAKNLFLGVFDHEFMYYPEPQTKNRHQEFFEWLKPIEKYVSDSLKDPQNVQKNDVLSHLRDLGVFRAQVSDQYVGLNLSQTELAKLIETLGCFPWLASYLVKNHIMPVRIISALGSNEQKAKYLPKIISGDIVPTLCFTEPENVHNVTSKAILSECETHWVLNGKKSFVINGHDSNLLLVLVECGENYVSEYSEKMMSVLLVERDFDGVTCTDVKDLAGQKNNPICTVTFRDTKVPKENLMGELGSGLSVLVDSLAPGNRDIAPQTIGVLRTFIKALTMHILQRKHLNTNMHEYEAVQEIIGRLATALYGMESMLYMTTGISDTYENQDCTLEKAMVEAYCANECATCIYEGLQIIGAQSYLEENPYIEIFKDALSHTLYDSYSIDSSMYISLIGLQHTGKHLREHVFKLRNPFTFPRHILETYFGKEHKLKLRLADHMHPSLQIGAKILEKCITRLQTASVMLLERHGLEISERQMELRRLSELATRTYALIAVLSRASRAYCIGLRNAEQERHVAGSFAILTLDRVQILLNEIKEGEWNNGDRLHKNIAELMYNKKDYFAEHPLNRTY